VSERVLMKGNEALAEAALRAGCRFFAGYPITPQTEILEYLSWRMDEVGGSYTQAESELAAINMVYGAAAGGARALTTSSGPGFSLKQEGISYLCGSDLPAVIVNVMRVGSGLGNIFQGQGDYWQMTRGGGHGDYRTIVLAPNSAQENADLMYIAFDLAEKYKHPVLIASDAAIGQSIEAVELPEFKEHDLNRYDWAVRGAKMDEKRRMVKNVFYEMGEPYEDYLRDKYAQIEAEEPELVLVAFGISSRVSEEAVEGARAKGLKVGLIRPITLWPFPVKAFEEAKNAKAYLTNEMNLLGQTMDDIRLATGCSVPVYHSGSIFAITDTNDLIARIEEVMEEVKGGGQ